MTVSLFDLFSIGIGPSSSHTVGPMRAAHAFASGLRDDLERVATLEIDVYGSLAATGEGHGTYDAILAGLIGFEPQTVDTVAMRSSIQDVAATGTLLLGGTQPVPFGLESIRRHPFTVLDHHTNGMRFVVMDAAGSIIADETWFSLGGGFIAQEGQTAEAASSAVPFPFTSAAELLAHCDAEGIAIHEVMRRNELANHTAEEISERISAIHSVMLECIDNGLRGDGVLPGGLNVPRRAKPWYDALMADAEPFHARLATDWLNVVALAVNEENAAGGRIVTAPTNGAAGIIPAVLTYSLAYVPHLVNGTDATRNDAVERFFLTAAAIGSLYKERASISGAEVGCQGEVGSASSMAAGALAEVLGGSPRQVENAAEIAMEHNLGLTCDPVGGLVQIPCIERNAIASAKAVNAATMAIRGNGEHRVSLDQVIETMRQTGLDMHSKYKETSRGGLAVNVVEC